MRTTYTSRADRIWPVWRIGADDRVRCYLWRYPDALIRVAAEG